MKRNKSSFLMVCGAWTKVSPPSSPKYFDGFTGREIRENGKGDVRHELASLALAHPFDGETNHLIRILEAQFLLDVRAVGLDRLNAQVEQARHAPGIFPLAEEFEDFKFPIRQLIYRVSGSTLRRLNRLEDELVSKPRTDKDFAFQHSPNSGHDMPGRLGFHQVTQSSRL